MPEHRGYWIYMEGGWRELRGRGYDFLFGLGFGLQPSNVRPRDSIHLSIRSDGALVLLKFAKLYQTS